VYGIIVCSGVLLCVVTSCGNLLQFDVLVCCNLGQCVVAQKPSREDSVPLLQRVTARLMSCSMPVQCVAVWRNVVQFVVAV